MFPACCDASLKREYFRMYTGHVHNSTSDMIVNDANGDANQLKHELNRCNFNIHRNKVFSGIFLIVTNIRRTYIYIYIHTDELEYSF